MNIYGQEKKQIIPHEEDKQPGMLSVDVDKDSFMELITEVRLLSAEVLKHPEKKLDIYMVCGTHPNPSTPWVEFFDYMDTLVKEDGLNVRLIYRGYLHFNTMGFLTRDYHKILVKSSRLVYDPARVHEVLSLLGNDPALLQAFLKRFYDRYRYLGPGSVIMDAAEELNKIGFKFELY
jgi:hypothetical protein